MVSFIQSNMASALRQGAFIPLVVSLAGHLLLLAVFVYSPTLKSDSPYIPGIIDVQIVELSAPANSASRATPEINTPAPIEDVKVPEEIPSLAPKAAPRTKPEVSVAPPKPKKKSALKYKTMKSKEVLKSTLKRLEKKVEHEPTRQLQDTIKRLQEQVDKQGRPDSATEPGPAEADGTKPGIFGQGSKQEAEAIDLYRLEVAFTINRNWAFSEQLAGRGQKLEVLVVIKVLPDGDISDIFFTDRSGNAFLDDSAYKAIKKSSPVKPHPPGLMRSYVEIGLRFTPQGVQ